MTKVYTLSPSLSASLSRITISTMFWNWAHALKCGYRVDFALVMGRDEPMKLRPAQCVMYQRSTQQQQQRSQHTQTALSLRCRPDVFTTMY